MRKWLPTCVLLLALPGHVSAAASPELLALLKSLEGQSKWLRIVVVRVQAPIRSTDCTNIYPDGTVKYKMGWGGSESTDSVEFIRGVETTILENNQPWYVRTIGVGSRVTISKADASDDEVGLELRDASGSKHKVRLKFKDAKWGYSAEDVNRLVAVGFASSEAEARGDASTVSLNLGMTVEQVIEAKGAPKSRVNLGEKTILTYDDLKLYFKNGKLVDVQ